ncbi:MAG: hypothetical protein KJZ98_04160 [Burkholderiaceae bacterium]|nr:hypothetical protein [Burkholderiaceae bacterium]
MLQVRKWTQTGVSLDRIRELLHGAPPAIPPRPRGPGTVEVWSHLVVADGVELASEPGRAGFTPEQVRALFAGATELVERVRGNDSPGQPIDPIGPG